MLTLDELGTGLNADYVVAGHIQKLGDRNLIHITIVDVKELQQIAGDYREYRSIEEVSTIFHDVTCRGGVESIRSTRHSSH